MESTSVTCRYTFDEAQFRIARRLATKSKGYYLKLTVFAAFLLVLCTYTAYQHVNQIWTGGNVDWGRLSDAYFPFLLCLIVFSLFIFLINPWQQIRSFRKGIACGRDYSYAIDATGITLHTAEVDAVVKWSLFESVTECPEGFVVRLKRSNAFDWLPQNGFASSDEYHRCREIFRAHTQLKKA